MKSIRLMDLIQQAMDATGADGLFNLDGECGCGRDDLSPGDCLSGSCELAKSEIVTEEDEGRTFPVGSTVWRPITIKGDVAVLHKDTP